MPDPIVLEPSGGTVLQVFDATLTIKVPQDATGGDYGVCEGVWRPGGFRARSHVHPSVQESFYILDGAFEFRVDTRRFVATAGSVLHVPKGAVHGFAATGDTDARLLFVHSPAMDGFYSGPRRPDPLRFTRR